MAFTDFWKQLNTFGFNFIDASIVTPHTDVVYDEGGTARYYNKDVPMNTGYDTQKLNNTNAWRFYAADVVDGTNMYDLITPATASFISASVSNNGVVFHFAIAAGSVSATIKSVAIKKTLRAFVSTSATSDTGYSFITSYKNLDTSITIPANESILLDITLSAGDIQSVQQG